MNMRLTCQRYSVALTIENSNHQHILASSTLNHYHKALLLLILQNSVDFPGGFVVSAIDKDENGTQKAEVR